MKEVIVVKETEQMKGAFSSFELKAEDDIAVGAFQTISLSLPFEFQPINFTTDIELNWTLAQTLARKGFVLNGVYPVDDWVAEVVVTNVTAKEQVVKEGSTLVSVSFTSKNMIKAIDYEKSKGVVNLNLGD